MPEFKHCCGSWGFGRSIHDMCPACRYQNLIMEGLDPKQAELRTKIEDYKSSAALFPHLREFCLQQAAELEKEYDKCRSCSETW